MAMLQTLHTVQLFQQATRNMFITTRISTARTVTVAACLFLFAACASADLCVEVQDHPEFGQWELSAVGAASGHEVYRGVGHDIKGSDVEQIVAVGSSVIDGRYFITIRDRKDSALLALVGEDGEGTVSRISISGEPKYLDTNEVKFSFCNSNNANVVAPAKFRGEFALDEVTLAAEFGLSSNSDIPPMCFRINGMGNPNVNLDYKQSDKFKNNYYQTTFGGTPTYGVQSQDGWTSILKVDTSDDEALSVLENYVVPMDHTVQFCGGAMGYLWKTNSGVASSSPHSSTIWDCREM